MVDEETAARGILLLYARGASRAVRPAIAGDADQKTRRTRRTKQQRQHAVCKHKTPPPRRSRRRRRRRGRHRLRAAAAAAAAAACRRCHDIITPPRPSFSIGIALVCTREQQGGGALRPAHADTPIYNTYAHTFTRYILYKYIQYQCCSIASRW